MMYQECPFCFECGGTKLSEIYEYDNEKKCYKGHGCDHCFDHGIIEIPDNFYGLVDYFLGE